MPSIKPILERLRASGFQFEVPVQRMRTELMRTTGVTDSKKLGNYMKVMCELGYSKMKGEQVLELCIDFDQPYAFLSDSGRKDRVEPSGGEVVGS